MSSVNGLSIKFGVVYELLNTFDFISNEDFISQTLSINWKDNEFIEREYLVKYLRRRIRIYAWLNSNLYLTLINKNTTTWVS